MIKNLCLSQSLSVSVFSRTSISNTLEHRYKLDKAITNAKTNGIRLRRRSRVRASNRRQETSTTPVQSSSSNNEVDDDNDDKPQSSFHETLKQAQPYLVTLIAVATVIRCVRRGRLR